MFNRKLKTEIKKLKIKNENLKLEKSILLFTSEAYQEHIEELYKKIKVLEKDIEQKRLETFGEKAAELLNHKKKLFDEILVKEEEEKIKNLTTDYFTKEYINQEAKNTNKLLVIENDNLSIHYFKEGNQSEEVEKRGNKYIFFKDEKQIKAPFGEYKFGIPADGNGL